jgi:hypothetical protein
MKTLKALGLALGLALTAIAAPACSAADGTTDASEEDVKSDKEFYGNDRVGAALKGHPELIPANFPQFEALFKVGRECQRKDSKEIFVVEESQTRLQLNVPEDHMHDVKKTKLMPRAVVAGCNTGDVSDPNTVKQSYSLFAALISDPDWKDSATGDTMRSWPLEVIALDEKTGLYNFYVFEPVVTPSDVFAPLPDGTKGKVTRVFRAIEDRPGKAGKGEYKVFQQKLEPGKPVAAPVQPAGGGNRCFNCHPNGAPLMNEIRDPWTNWVSFKKELPTSVMSGQTQAIVSEAVPNSTTGRSSLANDLEPIMRAAIHNYVYGPGGNAAHPAGWGPKTINGEQPGGLAHMLESVFCQTELNYDSSNQAVPAESFVDPDAAGPASLTMPDAVGDVPVPFLLPIRAVRDKETERWLVDHGYLSQADSMAIRLLDDENDIFSQTRCNVLKAVTTGLPKDPDAAREHIRAAVKASVPSMSWVASQPMRKAYVDALLTPGVRREEAQRNYVTELGTRFDAMDKSIAAIQKKESFRKSMARQMFPNASTPLPILTPGAQ